MHAKLQPRAAPRAALTVSVLLLAATGAIRPASADQDDDAERVPSSAADIYSPIQRTFQHQVPLPGGPQRPSANVPADDGPVLMQDAKDRLRFAGPFWRDLKIALYFRTHELDRNNASGPPSNAWAGGSALAFRTGYLDDWLQFEAAGATSQPLHAPAGEGGTLLLTDNQAEVSSFAIANAKLRGLGQEVTVGRQLIKTPYINPQDNRMLPNAVEGTVLMRRRDEAETFDYGIGYLWGFKARDRSYFVPFSEELGVAEDRGVLAGGAKVVPIPGLTIGAIDYLIADVVNTTFAEVDWIIPDGAMTYRLSANYTDQRTVGENLLGGAPYATRQVSGRVAASYREATLLVAGSINGDEAALKQSVRQLSCLYRARPARFQRRGPKDVRRRRGLRFLAHHRRRAEAANALRLVLGRDQCERRPAPERVQHRARVFTDGGSVREYPRASLLFGRRVSGQSAGRDAAAAGARHGHVSGAAALGCRVEPPLVGLDVRRGNRQHRRRQSMLAGARQHVAENVRALRTPPRLDVAQHRRCER